jgi:hypothetical protein
LIRKQTSRRSFERLEDLNDQTNLMLAFFGSENYFQGSKILPGIEIKVESYGQRSESFQTALKKIRPDQVVLYEPTLEFMRALEVYSCEMG